MTGWGPKQLAAAKERHTAGDVAIFDPLPLRSEVDTAGRYGLVLEGTVSRATPARDLIALIRAQPAQPRTFGRREDLGPFVRNQIAMQLRGRGWGLAAS